MGKDIANSEFVEIVTHFGEKHLVRVSEITHVAYRPTSVGLLVDVYLEDGTTINIQGKAAETSYHRIQLVLALLLIEKKDLEDRSSRVSALHDRGTE